MVEQRDSDGRLLYRYPGYRPDADKFDVSSRPSVLMGTLYGVGSSTGVMMALFALIVFIEHQR